MDKKVILFFIAILILLNVAVWQEVFNLQKAHGLEVSFLDVGQGDSAFIETPEGHQILIDGGPDESVLEKLSKEMPFWDRKIDLVILSHPEKDHMEGLLSVLKRYKADYILWTGVLKYTDEYKQWLEVLLKQKKMGAKIVFAESGQEIKAGNVLIDTLYPFENLFGQELKNTSNDTCVVSRIIYGKNSFLFIGDITSETEKNLVSHNNVLLSDVLKVAHHGSRYSTSEEFLSAVKPKIAVISVGKDNTYGHPTPEVLQKLEKFGIKVERTDQSGDIKIISDGNNIKLSK